MSDITLMAEDLEVSPTVPDDRQWAPDLVREAPRACARLCTRRPHRTAWCVAQVWARPGRLRGQTLGPDPAPSVASRPVNADHSPFLGPLQHQD